MEVDRMRGAGGPLGLLLMVAPLIAIPVFATVGIPQFAPVAASSLGEEELDPTSPWGANAEPEATPVPQRPADDLFAPVSGSSASDATISKGRPKASADQFLDDTPPPLIPPRRKPRRGSDAPDDGMDGWDEVPADAELGANRAPLRKPARTLPEEVVVADEGEERPTEEPQVEEQASADQEDTGGFKPDLLEPVAGRGGNSLKGKTADARNDRERPGRDRSRDFGDEEFNWDVAAERLKKLGIESYQLVAITAEKRFSFSCSVTNPANPQVTRKFIATADGPLLAVQKAIQQIDDWQTKSP